MLLPRTSPALAFRLIFYIRPGFSQYAPLADLAERRRLISTKRIVVVGAGPTGLEAALYGLALGHEAQVFEKGYVGQNMRNWDHVRLFSPWSINHSPLGVESIQQVGVDLPAPDDYLSGTEYVASHQRARL